VPPVAAPLVTLPLDVLGLAPELGEALPETEPVALPPALGDALPIDVLGLCPLALPDALPAGV
jgi:hypothetical protein